ncbi:AMP-binding protein [Micromonospora sp. KLBMP9576]|uniref:AMP-binding protein n=1 Tax=Micromonospora sp. KLBMP9576 TaxID=3424769 RepID=UPI003D94CD33
MATHAGTVGELLRTRAKDQPDRLGYAFLADGEQERLPLTYGGADERASAVAAGLRAAGCLPGSRVILVLPPGLDYLTAFFGCLYAGVVAVPVYPPDPFQLERSLPRLLAIVRDAGPVVALTTAPLLGFLDEVTRLAPELGAMRWLAVDEMPAAADGEGEPEPLRPDSTALLQYTSGSTSSPRGVVLSHRNLLHNSSVIQRLFRTTPESRGLVWLPPYHDMGLIGGLLQPLYGGLPVTLMSPLHFLEEPMRWLRAIHRNGATVSGGPNFAYDLCARRFDPERDPDLDLSSWEVAFDGAEPIRPATLRRFAETFAPFGFRPGAFLPCYGLAEATLMVTGTGGIEPGQPAAALPEPVAVDRDALERHVAAPPGDGPVAQLTSCGRSVPEQIVAIVDPATATRCGPGRVGEIWVAGPSVASGYWGRPDESAEVFGARLAGRDESFLRTGDLGFLRDGQLVITGRSKDLIIVRGRNHYPQDIEFTAERADPVLRPGCTAAFLAGDDRLVLVHEARRQAGSVDVAAVTARVREAVAREHGLQAHTVVLIRAGGLPKTSSGKVQRRLCRSLLSDGALPEIGRDTSTVAPDADRVPTASAAPDLAADRVRAAAPDDRPAALESYLRSRVAPLTGTAPADLDPAEPLLAAGLDSLAVVQLKNVVEAELGLRLPLPDVLGGATLGAVAAGLADQLAAAPDGAAVPPAPDRDVPAAGTVAPLSHQQRRMWILHRLAPENTAYTISVALRLPEPVDRDALRRAFDALVARHAALRTTFPVRDGEPVQLVAPDGRAAYQEHDARTLDDRTLTHWLTRSARRPFDLEAGPLLRLDLYRGAGGEVLLLAVHHIIADFWSLSVLGRDLGLLYDGCAGGREVTLPPPAATFADFAAWQRSLLADPAQERRLGTYWDSVVGDGVPPLSLPPLGDHPPARGGSRYFALPADLAARLPEHAAAQRVTRYVLMLAAFQAVLHELTGRPDLVVAANAAARSRAEFAQVVGCFLNPLVIRSAHTPGEPFRALLSRTRDAVIGALEHQDYPMTMAAERHGIQRVPMAEALFSLNRSLEHGDDLAAVGFVGRPGVRRSLGSLAIERFPLPAAETGLAVEMVLAEIDSVPHGVLRYRGDALDADGADRLVARFVRKLRDVVTEPDAVSPR